jgi:hypothetical protein
MTETVGQMTPSELSDLIENILEKKLLELFIDPDQDLELNELMSTRLREQRDLVSSGERGLSIEAVRRQLMDD